MGGAGRSGLSIRGVNGCWEPGCEWLAGLVSPWEGLWEVRGLRCEPTGTSLSLHSFYYTEIGKTTTASSDNFGWQSAWPLVRETVWSIVCRYAAAAIAETDCRGC